MKTTTCRHFNGLTVVGDPPGHKSCAVGINPRDFAGHDGMITLPCLSNRCCKPCPKFDPYTQEEVDAEDREINLIFTKIEKVSEAIDFHHNSTGQWSGNIPCPACKTGQVSFSIARCNGHRRARCSTEGCVAWLE